MRLLHSADWHLGHTLHDLPRTWEHACFLEWLLEQAVAVRADVLVVSGDVFDTANPPAAAQAAWYGFLARLRGRAPDLQVVVTGGNHDSAARLDAPAAVLDAMRVHVVGGLPRLPGGALDVDRLVVPLRDRAGEIRAWIAAVPFLRPADLPAVDAEDGDPLVEGVRRVYTETLDAARARRQPGQALLATGHGYMVGGEISELSERKVLGGNQHALPVDVFPDDVAYVALGHLHLAQAVGGRGHVRYSGSPLPLSMSEADYRHQVLLVELDGERLAEVTPLRVPRAVDLVRLPASGPSPLPDVRIALQQLPAAQDVPPERHPYLQVDVRLDHPEPGLRRQVEEALAGRAARLVQLSVHYTGTGASLAEASPVADLRQLTPEAVFRLRYARDHAEPPPDALLACFAELTDTVAQEGAS